MFEKLECLFSIKKSISICLRFEILRQLGKILVSWRFCKPITFYDKMVEETEFFAISAISLLKPHKIIFKGSFKKPEFFPFFY